VSVRSRPLRRLSWTHEQPDDRIAMRATWPGSVTPEWAWGGADGSGVRVAIVDSGVDGAHAAVGGVDRAVAIETDAQGVERAVQDGRGDLCGHGTACAGIVRGLAPACGIASVRVLGEQASGGAGALIAGMRWAVEEGYDVVNMSLSTTRRQFAEALHELADDAYFGRTVIVASAHNVPVESFPWRFASVISVGSHLKPDPRLFYYNPSPPVEFFAHGLDVSVAWSEGKTVTVSGNSFATAHVTGICALVLSKHPGLTPFQLKSVLCLTAANVEPGER
jgi:subtilisin